MALDRVDQAIISQALVAAVKETRIRLVRSADSPIVREANDCCAALLDVQGHVVSQAELTRVPPAPNGISPIDTPTAPA